jgi:hypothetical protein
VGTPLETTTSVHVARQVLNTLRMSPRPIAWWRATDFCFNFGRAFIRPESAAAFRSLHAIWTRHPNTRIALFGHADPVGQDDYNKKLSENRAKIVYGALCREPDVWKEVFYAAKEEVRYIQRQLKFLQLYSGHIDGDFGPLTQKAVQDYMDQLCGPLQLKTSDFLHSGKHAFQGCSEFNPVRMMSRRMWETFKVTGLENLRDRENSPNRRVVAFLFLDYVASQLQDSWPCRPAAEGVGPCRSQFWSDASSRRQYQAKAREYRINVESENPIQGISAADILFNDEDVPGDEDSAATYLGTDDTFCCRFYERLTRFCKSEQIETELVSFSVQIADYEDEQSEFEYRLSTDTVTRYGVTLRAWVEEWLPPDTAWCNIQWRGLSDLPMAEDDLQFSESLFMEL